MNLSKHLPVEFACWTGAIVLLGLAEPSSHQEAKHFSLCLLTGAGLDWCPGCGLGRSLTLLLHGNIRESLAMHWLGIPAMLIIVHRIWILGGNELRKFKMNYKKDTHV